MSIEDVEPSFSAVVTTESAQVNAEDMTEGTVPGATNDDETQSLAAEETASTQSPGLSNTDSPEAGEPPCSKFDAPVTADGPSAETEEETEPGLEPVKETVATENSTKYHEDSKGVNAKAATEDSDSEFNSEEIVAEILDDVEEDTSIVSAEVIIEGEEHEERNVDIVTQKASSNEFQGRVVPEREKAISKAASTTSGTLESERDQRLTAGQASAAMMRKAGSLAGQTAAASTHPGDSDSQVAAVSTVVTVVKKVKDAGRPDGNKIASKEEVHVTRKRSRELQTKAPVHENVPSTKNKKARKVALERLRKGWEERQIDIWKRDPTAPICPTTPRVVGHLQYSIESIPLELLQGSQTFLTYVPL